VEIISPGGLPAGMTREDLGKKSIPRNPLLFGLFFRMDVVEQPGSGIKRILDLSREYGTPEPVIETDNNWVTVTFPRDPAKAGILEGSEGPVKRPESGAESENVLRIFMKGLLSMKEIAALLYRKTITGALKRRVTELLEHGFIERTIPEKPGSRLQKYRLTEKGKSLIEELNKK